MRQFIAMALVTAMMLGGGVWCVRFTDISNKMFEGDPRYGPSHKPPLWASIKRGAASYMKQVPVLTSLTLVGMLLTWIFFFGVVYKWY